MGVVDGGDGSQRRWVRGGSSVVDGSGIGWWVSVLGKTVGRGCRGFRNSMGWDVGVLEKRE